MKKNAMKIKNVDLCVFIAFSPLPGNRLNSPKFDGGMKPKAVDEEMDKNASFPTQSPMLLKSMTYQLLQRL